MPIGHEASVYGRMVIAGRRIVSVRLTPAAYATGSRWPQGRPPIDSASPTP